MQKKIISTAEEGDIVGSGDGRRSAPHLCRAEEYIHAHLREPFSLFDLIAAVGTSPSTLLRTFNAHHGVPPMQYVRRLRLEAVRNSLLAAEPENGTVAKVASECGFQQLGRFSAQYRKAFGELPSVTLRRYRLIDRKTL